MAVTLKMHLLYNDGEHIRRYAKGVRDEGCEARLPPATVWTFGMDAGMLNYVDSRQRTVWAAVQNERLLLVVVCMAHMAHDVCVREYVKNIHSRCF